jgi:hypothetical protein
MMLVSITNSQLSRTYSCLIILSARKGPYPGDCAHQSSSLWLLSMWLCKKLSLYSTSARNSEKFEVMDMKCCREYLYSIITKYLEEIEHCFVVCKVHTELHWTPLYQ